MKLVCVGSGQVEEHVDPDLTGLVVIIGPYLLTQPRKPSASYKPNREVSFVETVRIRKRRRRLREFSIIFLRGGGQKRKIARKNSKIAARMGASSSTEQKVSTEQREVESLAASTGALPMLRKSFSRLADPQTNAVPIRTLQVLNHPRTFEFQFSTFRNPYY